MATKLTLLLPVVLKDVGGGVIDRRKLIDDLPKGGFFVRVKQCPVTNP